MVAAAGSQESPFRSVSGSGWNRGVTSPLGKRKQIVALTLSEQGQREQQGDRSPAHPPGTAPRAQRPLCPGLCWLLFQESDSPPSSSLQAKSEACSPVGAQGEAHQTRDSQLLS